MNDEEFRLMEATLRMMLLFLVQATIDIRRLESLHYAYTTGIFLSSLLQKK